MAGRCSLCYIESGWFWISFGVDTKNLDSGSIYFLVVASGFFRATDRALTLIQSKVAMVITVMGFFYLPVRSLLDGRKIVKIFLFRSKVVRCIHSIRVSSSLANPRLMN